MKPESQSSSGGAVVAVVLLLLLIITVVVVGFGAGFYFLASARATRFANIQSVASPPVTTSAVNAAGTVMPVASFPLSALDIKDTLEAPVVAIDKQGRVHVAFASQTAKDQRTLFLATSTDGGQTFAEPRTIRTSKIFTSVSQMKGKEVKRPLRLLPQLTAAGDDLYLGWIEPDDALSTVFFYVAKSTDGGDTFGEPQRVHDSQGARPTFTSLTSDDAGNLAASWLDNRAGIQQPFASVRLAGKEPFEIESQVYSSPEERGVCPCCPTTTLLTPDGRVIVAFRNQLEGYRDIFVVEKKLTDEDFGAPQRVVTVPTWKFDGCPHDGPALATDGTTLFVGWMDAHKGTPRCYVATRPLAGGDFTPPEGLNVTTTAAQGNVKLSVNSDEQLLAVWEEATGASTTTAESTPAASEEAGGHQHGAMPGSSRAIHQAWRDSQGSWAPVDVLLPVEGAFQARVAVAQRGNIGPVYVWNELDEQGKRVVIARLPPANIAGAGSP